MKPLFFRPHSDIVSHFEMLFALGCKPYPEIWADLVSRWNQRPSPQHLRDLEPPFRWLMSHGAPLPEYLMLLHLYNRLTHRCNGEGEPYFAFVRFLLANGLILSDFQRMRFDTKDSQH